MKQHIGHLVPLSEASRAWNKKWYTAEDVAELVKHVLELTLYGPMREEVMAELDQIVRENEQK